MRAAFLAIPALLSCLVWSARVAAEPVAATPATQVGDVVTNPTTGVDSKVVSLVKDSSGEVIQVETAAGDVILTKTQVGDLIRSQDPASTDIYKVISVVTNATTGLVETVNVRLTTAAESDPTTAMSVA